VNCSPALKWFVALSVPLTLAWKIPVGPEDPNHRTSEIIKFLANSGFDVTFPGKLIDLQIDAPNIRAISGVCQMLIVEISPDGSERDEIHGFATATAERVFIVFQGRVYAEQPVLLTLANNLWSRFLGKLRLARHITPVLAVIATESCAVQQLPWNLLYQQERFS